MTWWQTTNSIIASLHASDNAYLVSNRRHIKNTIFMGIIKLQIYMRHVVKCSDHSLDIEGLFNTEEWQCNEKGTKVFFKKNGYIMLRRYTHQHNYIPAHN